MSLSPGRSSGLSTEPKADGRHWSWRAAGWVQERSPSLAPAVVPPPGGLHRLWVHAELIEEQQQQALAAAGVGGVDGGWHRCRGWCGRALEVLGQEGEQVGVAQARPAAQAVLAAEGLQLGFGEAIELEIRRQQHGGGFGQQVVVALVDALGLAVEVGVEAAGVAGEDAAAAGAPLRDAEPRRTGGRPDDMAERGRYAVVAVVRWLELTR